MRRLWIWIGIELEIWRRRRSTGGRQTRLVWGKKRLWRRQRGKGKQRGSSVVDCLPWRPSLVSAGGLEWLLETHFNALRTTLAIVDDTVHGSLLAAQRSAVPSKQGLSLFVGFALGLELGSFLDGSGGIPG